MWGLIAPPQDNLSPNQWEELEADVFTKTGLPMRNVRREHVFLTPGSCMWVLYIYDLKAKTVDDTPRILPPDMSYEVFTPISSVAIGSNFYCYDTMPATELAMRRNRKHIKSKTITHASAAILVLTQMVLSLPSIYEGMTGTNSWYPLRPHSSAHCCR